MKERLNVILNSKHLVYSIFSKPTLRFRYLQKEISGTMDVLFLFLL